MSIEKKSIATLIDELVTTSQKCWHAQERVCDKRLPDAERLAAGELAQITNARRCALMRAIDERFGDATGLPKTYA